MVRNLSKSKLLAFRQCAKRLWLEVHRPDLNETSASAGARQATGNDVGALARRIFDPDERGTLVDAQADGYDAAFSRTRALLEGDAPIFEAGFVAGGAMFFADVMHREPAGWAITEVKSTGSVKDYHLEDAAVQAFVARAAGVHVASISIAHIDTEWVYPGAANYGGLFMKRDVTDAAMGLSEEVGEWISEAQAVVSSARPPTVSRSRHCTSPFECGFHAHCKTEDPDSEYPAHWLPRVTSKALKALIHEEGTRDLRLVPDELLNPLQHRVKSQTLAGERYFDAVGARADVGAHPFPLWFLDFETIQFAVPLWQGTKPFEQLPFQFSLHRLGETGELDHFEFLDLSGNDPSRALAAALVANCEPVGTVYAYNAAFERRVIRELATKLPDLSGSLLAIADRLVDLLPITRDRLYDPTQHGSWSIKKVLPVVAPDLDYSALAGVRDGGMAMDAFLEAISTTCAPERREELRRQLVEYCQLDTFAMVRLWRFLAGEEQPASAKELA